MIRLIIKQLWNQRIHNVWIFLEIIIAGVFLWYTVDPAFVLSGTRMQPKGYVEEQCYGIQIGMKNPMNKNYDKSVTPEQMIEALKRMVSVVKNLPEVESFYLSSKFNTPNGGSFNGVQFFPDTTSIAEMKYYHAQWWNVYNYDGSDILKTLRFTDARTGMEMTMQEGNNICYISDNVARNMFGDKDAVNQKLYVDRQEVYTIKGVYNNVKTEETGVPYAHVIFCEKDDKMGFPFPMITVRLKDDVDGEVFAADFMDKIAPTIKGCNLSVENVCSLKEMRIKNGIMFNLYNRQALQYGLITFTLLCIFLGMVGTFWIRTNTRRQEIGLMRSIGASEAKITSQFMCESWLLVTIGFVVSMIIVINMLAAGSGMAVPEGGYDVRSMVDIWMFHEIPHFVLVTLISYLLLLVISLIGTYIPIHRASKVLPADALRDE